MTKIRTVYVIDDDSMVRRSTTFFLNSSGYETRPFVGATDFLDSMSYLSPGALLLDMRMPEMDGLQLLSKFDERARLCFPTIVVTGHGDVATAVQAMKHGANDFIEKPYEESVLLAALERALSRLATDAQAVEEKTNALARIALLSEREIGVLQGLMAGNSNKALAQKFDLSPRTIEMHRSNLMRHLSVNSLSEAIRIAVVAGVTS